MICPICNGTGALKDPPKNQKKGYMAQREKQAKKLRAKGFSIRAIATQMGYKSPLSVQLLLSK